MAERAYYVNQIVNDDVERDQQVTWTVHFCSYTVA